MRNFRQESDFYFILDPWIKLIWFDKSRAWCYNMGTHIWPPRLGTESAQNERKLQKLLDCCQQIARRLCKTTTHYPVYHIQFLNVLCIITWSFMSKLMIWAIFLGVCTQFMWSNMCFQFSPPELLMLFINKILNKIANILLTFFFFESKHVNFEQNCSKIYSWGSEWQ